MKIGTKIKAEPGKAEPRLRSAIRLAALAAAAVFLVLYDLDVRDRSTAHECKREDFGDYTGETCYLAHEYGTLFRLYAARSDELLAERTYLEPNAPRLLWFHDHVLYDIGARDGKGYVTLPPTRWDWLRARLP